MPYALSATFASSVFRGFLLFVINIDQKTTNNDTQYPIGIHYKRE